MRSLRGFYTGFPKPLSIFKALIQLSLVYALFYGDTYYGDRSIFEFRAVANKQNVFTMWSHNYQPPRQLYSNKSKHLCAKDDGDNVSTADNALWYILRVHPETPEESMCYMIWLGTDFKRCPQCLQANGNCHSIDTISSTDPNHDNLWILDEAIKAGNIFNY